MMTYDGYERELWVKDGEGRSEGGRSPLLFLYEFLFCVIEI